MWLGRQLVDRTCSNQVVLTVRICPQLVQGALPYGQRCPSSQRVSSGTRLRILFVAATLRRDRQLADHLGLKPGMLLVRIQLALSMRLWRNLVGRTTLRTWAFGRVSSSLTSRTCYGSWSAWLSVKQLALNCAVDAEWFDSFTTHLQRLRLVPKQVS